MKPNTIPFASVAACLISAMACATAPAVEQSEAPVNRPLAVQYRLMASPKTVVWGYYDAAATPVLHVKSGDFVEVGTMLTNTPTGLERA